MTFIGSKIVQKKLRILNTLGVGLFFITITNSLMIESMYDICISNAQYSSFSAQQNLWCEILEF